MDLPLFIVVFLKINLYKHHVQFFEYIYVFSLFVQRFKYKRYKSPANVGWFN